MGRSRVGLFDDSSVGFTTNKMYVNYNEDVNVSVDIGSGIDVSSTGYDV